jgi:hypothetical protein
MRTEEAGLTTVADEYNGLHRDLLSVAGDVGDVQRQHDDVWAEEELGHPQRREAAVDTGLGERVQED